MRCIDRSGREVDTHDNPTGFFRLLYDRAAGKPFLFALTRPVTSSLAGRFLNTRFSRPLIAPFIRSGSIDMREYPETRYRSFNDFFRRRIRDGVRPIADGTDELASPCDGKLTVFPITDDARFEIKGISYTMGTLLRDSKLAQRFRGGTLMLFRLTVDDYHRYCYAADGVESARVHLPGILHTVDPFAAERRAIYRENAREYSLLETPEFGTVLTMEIGALMVGKIVNHHPVGDVSRGEEKGWFEFGASSIVLGFARDAVIPDADLLRNSADGTETLVKYGERIARAAQK